MANAFARKPCGAGSSSLTQDVIEDGLRYILSAIARGVLCTGSRARSSDPAPPRAVEPRSTGGCHATSHHRIDIARCHRLQPSGDGANTAARGGDCANRHRRHQAADRDRCAALFRRRQRHAGAGPDQRRLEGQRRHLPAHRLDRSLGRPAKPRRSTQGRGCSSPPARPHSSRPAAQRRRRSCTSSSFLRADVDKPAETAPAVVTGDYRTSAPIPDLRPGGYDLNLTRVTFPAGMPSNAPHHRSGAALYYVLVRDRRQHDRRQGNLASAGRIHLRTVRSRAPVGQSRQRAADLHHLQHQPGRCRGGASGRAGKNAIAFFLQPKVKAKASAPGSRNSIAKVRSFAPFPCRIS